MKVEYSRSAFKNLKKIPRKKRIQALLALEKIKKDPLVGKKLVGRLKGLRSVRVWPYRIVYFFNERENYLFIDEIWHRQGVYRK